MAKAVKTTFKKSAQSLQQKMTAANICFKIGFQTDLNALNVVEESITFSKHANFASVRNAVTKLLRTREQ